MITVLIYGCLWWSQNPDDKEIGYSNVLTCLHPYKENRCNDLQPIACAIRFTFVPLYQNPKIVQFSIVLCHLSMYSIWNQAGFYFGETVPRQSPMSNASLPSQIAMYACSCKRAGRQKTVAEPDISRQFGSECPCYCSCGFIKVHWLHLSFKNNFYLVT